MSHWTEEFFVENPDLFAAELEGIADRAGEETEALLSLVAEEFDHRPSTVLDVGCGLGRHCREFAAAGLDVTGIDISPAYLRRARERAERAGVDEHVTFLNADMRDLDAIDETFDLVVCLYNTFGYFDDETNRAILREMREHLAEDGVCALQVTNKDASLTNLQSSAVREFDFGVVVSQHEFDTRTSRLTITRDVLRGTAPDLEYDGRATYSVRQYSPPGVARDAGFDSVSLFGGYDGAALSLDRGHVVALAR